MGVLTASALALGGWAYELDNQSVRHEVLIKQLDKNDAALMQLVNTNQSQLIDIQKDTVQLLHQQDNRLTVIETVLKEQINAP
ncbi:hypothetical protein [Vibrio panuliri]|uniref:Chemotaxis protein n=1 Tax=Vibrio panuliri TaxID=1381081 RepID=A0ABX3FG69_9VIBR|nr:hypothetical protein [Vibrio panuliri]KAB1460898.1 hypothetical protein F7O85_00545 [Vibrio panuliri]OLQ91651.1 hypothetical protein BIY20_09620 [Vibrio panuliri]